MKGVPTLRGGEQANLKVKTRRMERKVLMVIAPENFRDEEYFKTKEILQKDGIRVATVSKKVGEATGMLGGKVVIDQELVKEKASDYEAVIFIGGSGAAVYFDDQDALALARAAFEEGKVVGAICVAPSILANAGLLSGKKATAFSSERENLVAKGAQYTGQLVTVDGKIITANGPKAAEEFGRKLVELLGR